MKSIFTLTISSVIAACLLHICAYAQGPTIDPTFQAAYIYNAMEVQQVIEQPDGKRLLLNKYEGLTYSSGLPVGRFMYLNGTPVGQLVRLLPGGVQLDTVFARNLKSLIANILQVILLPNGKIMLVPEGNAQLGGISRRGLMQLNSDGTLDTSFTPSFNGIGPSNNNVAAIAAQPDGKIIVAGDFLSATGSQINGLRRLEPNGALDALFQANTSSLTVVSHTRNCLAIQPDGKILVSGNGLVRLLPTGVQDASFSAVVPTSTTLQNIALQADGKLVITTNRGVAGSGAWPPLLRLLPNGTIDSSFATGTNFNDYLTNTYKIAGASLAIQPDGKILVATKATSYNGSPIGHVVRLLADGSLDPGFANTNAAPEPRAVGPTWLQVLANGQLLVAGPTVHYAPANSPATGVALLNAAGTRDMAFLPRATKLGSIADVVLQPDGKYIIGGSFTEINDVPAENVARLSANGIPDNAFAQAAMADATVTKVVLQPDGKVLLGGLFKRVAGTNQADVARLLPTGEIDAAFAPNVSITGAEVDKIAVQPDGKVLLARRIEYASSISQPPFIRLDGQTGQVDASFQAGSVIVRDCFVQPDGSIVAAGYGYAGSAVLWRMLPNGAFDPTFTPTYMPGVSRYFYTGKGVMRDGLGRWYLTVSEAGPNGIEEKIKRRLPNGADDTSFPASILFFYGRINSAVAQPNNRVLLGGMLSGYRLIRLLENGTNDPSFQAANGPALSVNRLLVQPDGKIMAAGDFIEVGGTPLHGLVRLLDSNVLSVARSQSAAHTMAWPVPAHGNLNLRLDAAARPRQVALLNTVGQVVLSVTVTQAEMTLPLVNTAPGIYLLQVSYADGIVTRHVVIE